MKIESPDTGVQLEINPSEEHALPSEGRVQAPRELDRNHDGVINVADKPDDVPVEQWKKLLGTIFDATAGQAALQPAWNAQAGRLSAVYRMQRSIEETQAKAKADKIWDRVAQLLDGTGLRINPEPVAQGGTTFVYEVLKGDKSVESIQVDWRASAEEIAAQAKQAAGL